MSNKKNSTYGADTATNQLMAQLMALTNRALGETAGDLEQKKRTGQYNDSDSFRESELQKSSNVLAFTMKLHRLGLRGDSAKTEEEKTAIKREVEELIKVIVSHIESVPSGGYLNPGLEPMVFRTLHVEAPPGYNSKLKDERVKTLEGLVGVDGGETGGSSVVQS